MLFIDAFSKSAASASDRSPSLPGNNARSRSLLHGRYYRLTLAFEENVDLPLSSFIRPMHITDDYDKPRHFAPECAAIIATPDIAADVRC